jgi:hypothetical protein
MIEKFWHQIIENPNKTQHRFRVETVSIPIMQPDRIMNFEDFVSTLFDHQRKNLDHQHKIIRRT